MSEPHPLPLDGPHSPSGRGADDADDHPARPDRARVRRLVELLDLLRVRERTLSELAEWFGLPERSVERDLHELADIRAGVQEVRPGVYRVPAAVRPLDPAEALAAHVAARLIHHAAPLRQRRLLVALDKLAEHLPDPARRVARRAVLPPAPGLPDDRTFDTVARAWFEGRVLSFDYLRPGGSGRTYRHELEVYLVEAARDTLALRAIGRDRADGVVRAFTLSRVRAAELLPERYTVPDDFDPVAHLHDAWGDPGGDRAAVVTLRFTYAAAARLLEGAFPGLEVTTIRGDHSVEVQVRAVLDDAGRPGALLSWILGWGASVEVLGPPEVRAAWQREIRALFALHGGPDDAPWTPLSPPPEGED